MSFCLRWLTATLFFLATCATAFGQLVEAPKPAADAAQAESPKADQTKPDAPKAEPPAAAASDKPVEKPSEKSAAAQTQKWEFGTSIRATGGPCAGLLGTFAVPDEWPEQQVKVVTEQISPSVQHRYRSTDGLKQMVFNL